MGDSARRLIHKKGIDRMSAYIESDAFQNATIADIEVRLERLNTLFDQFETEHMDIVQDIGENDPAFELEDVILSTVETNYFNTKAKFIDKLNSLNRQQQQIVNQEDDLRTRFSSARGDDTGVQSNIGVRENLSITIDNPNRAIINDPTEIAGAASIEAQQHSARSCNSRAATGLQLAPQQLPKFNGDFSQWLSYRDLYLELVHNDEHLLPISKFNALANSLIGDAAHVIAGLQRSASNYEIAWQLVSSEYNKPRLIHESLMKAISSLKPISSENLPSLKYVVSKFKQTVRQLETLGTNVDACDQMLNFQLCQLLDPVTRRDWELLHTTNESLPLTKLFEFLDRRINSLSMVANATASTSRHTSSNANRPNVPQLKSVVVKQVNHASKTNNQCPCCKGEFHHLSKCSRFLKLNPFIRTRMAMKKKACFGCLSYDHGKPECTVPVCNHCTAGVVHHKFLCFDYCDKKKQESLLVNQISTQPLQQQEIHVPNDEDVLLGTVLIKILSASGECITVRALCDTGSQANLITEECIRQLNIRRSIASTSISTLGQTDLMQVRGVVKLKLMSCHDSTCEMNITALVVRKIAAVLPGKPISTGTWSKQIRDNLADPTFHNPGRIHMLLGANIWSRIIKSQIHRNDSNDLVAQLTRFGYVMFGGLQTNVEPFVGSITENQISNNELHEALQQFWKLDEVESRKHRSNEEEMCEEMFMQLHKRTHSGRYIVPIPIKPDAKALGNSKNRALKQFISTEAKFSRDTEYRNKYIAFMDNFRYKGFMTEITELNPNQMHFYVPHHGIFNTKRDKFRVVFNGSATTTSGESFNEIQMKGERLQDKLSDILLRFRLPRIALIADIEQMYPQVLIREEDHQLQLILWRDAPNQPIRTYALNTVTFGMKYAPHSAIRAMRQCAIDEANKFPIASEVALRDFYVDDLISGCDSEHDAIELYSQMNGLMNAGRFPIKKWSTNSWAVSAEMLDGETDSSQVHEFNDIAIHSVLGVTWIPMQDHFQFKLKNDSNMISKLTKRKITSELATLFDPIGLLAPVVLQGKVLVKDLWNAKYEWDEELPQNIIERWQTLCSTLPNIESIKIPRWIGSHKSKEFELHGFSDASEKAYAAVIYYRVKSLDGQIRCGILSSKSRVAKSLSIPRLELCGALLLAKLMQSVRNAFSGRHITEHYWCDSTIVLAWLKRSPHSLKTFVANRVAEIQTLTTNGSWHHVSSTDNPADIASRGANAYELLNMNLWWNGPSWLPLQDEHWLIQNEEITASDKAIVEEESKSPIVAVTINTEEAKREKQAKYWIANEIEGFAKLCLITAFVQRFVRHCKTAVEKRKLNEIHLKHNKISSINRVKPISSIELIKAEIFWCKKAQEIEFESEYHVVRGKQTINQKEKFAKLSPKLDEDGVIRSDGRLTNAPISYEEKYPIILSGDSIITKKIIKMHHLRQLHGGVALVTRCVRQKYWILGGRNAIRNGIFNCKTCTRHRKEACAQKMAPLVKSRVTGYQRAFTNTSIDYAGPFELKRWIGRCKSFEKCYVAVFICMATRAIHLELVLDLTTDAFIDAYQRFAARRGHCKTITTDNAKCFVGAKKKFDEIHKTWLKCASHSSFTSHGIDWKFIMPRSPAQGGSHEAAVKLFKYHLKRVVGKEKLAVPQFQSLIIKIERALNSRPLNKQSDDASDELALTPAHFLIGGAFEAASIESPVDEKQSLTSKYRKMQFMYQHFWRKWQLDYINHLHCRNIWLHPVKNLQVGDVVLLKDDNLPPEHWSMGKIIEVHADAEGNVRNVSIKQKNGVVQRAVQKLVKLLDCENQEDISPGGAC